MSKNIITKNSYTKKEMLKLFQNKDFNENNFSKDSIVYSDILLNSSNGKKDQNLINNQSLNKKEAETYYISTSQMIEMNNKAANHYKNQYSTNGVYGSYSKANQDDNNNNNLNIQNKNSNNSNSNKWNRGVNSTPNTNENNNNKKVSKFDQNITVKEEKTDTNNSINNSINQNTNSGTNLYKDFDINTISLINDKLNYPKSTPLWYIYHAIAKSSYGPVSSNQLINMANTKMVDFNSRVRLIDVFQFVNHSVNFNDFESDANFIKLGELVNYIDKVTDSVYMSYTELYKTSLNSINKTENNTNTNTVNNTVKQETTTTTTTKPYYLSSSDEETKKKNNNNSNNNNNNNKKSNKNKNTSNQEEDDEWTTVGKKKKKASTNTGGIGIPSNAKINNNFGNVNTNTTTNNNNNNYNISSKFSNETDMSELLKPKKNFNTNVFRDEDDNSNIINNIKNSNPGKNNKNKKTKKKGTELDVKLGFA